MYFRSSLKDYEEYGDFSKLWKGEGVLLALQTVSNLEKDKKQKTPVSKAFVRSILQGCLRRRRNLSYAMQIHVILVRNGLLFTDDCISEELIRLFALCENSLDSANRVFSTLPNPPGLYSWNAIISSHVSYGKEELALRLYDLMSSHYMIQPDKVTYLHVLKACGNMRNVEAGRLIHRDLLVRCGSRADDPVIKTSIIDMYGKCGDIDDAENVFCGLHERDVVSWGSMLSGIIASGDTFRAICLFKRMQEEGRKVSENILSSLLTLCGDSRDLRHGRLVHDHVIINNFYSDDMILGNNLVELYVKCGSLREANKVFDSLPFCNSVTWTLIISGYVIQGDGVHALELYAKMMKQGDVKPDKVMFIFVLKACSIVGAILHGMVIHERTIRDGLDKDLAIENALLEMYAKCGNIKEAQNVFVRMKKHDVVAWGTLSCGFAQSGDLLSMLSLFRSMNCEESIKPDSVIFTNLLKSCCNMGLTSEGCKLVESMARNHNINPEVEHYSSMIDLLGRVGQLHEAEDLLITIPGSCIKPMPQTSFLANCRTYGNVNLGAHASMVGLI